MQIVFLLDHVARRLGLPLTLVIRGFLILADSLGVLLAGRLILRAASVSVLRPLLLGWSLNPIAILLVCQHANFDGLVAICILMVLLCTIDFLERPEAASWLWACCWLGMGVVLKTIPMALAPLLSTGWRLSRRTRVLGVVLVVGPALYGLSILYALGPAQIRAHVLGYRGLPGWFGISGLLAIAGRQAWVPVYRTGFALAVVSGMVWLAARVRRRVSPRGCVLAAAAMLTAIPAFGPGYGAQYIAWSLPLLLVLWAIGDRRTRAVLLGFGTVAVLTYVVDYALMSSHGAFLVAATDDPTVLRLSQRLATPRGSTLERLPLFGAYLVLVAQLVGATRRELDAASGSTPTGARGRRRHQGWYFHTARLAPASIRTVLKVPNNASIGTARPLTVAVQPGAVLSMTHRTPGSRVSTSTTSVSPVYSRTAIRAAAFSS